MESYVPHTNLAPEGSYAKTPREVDFLLIICVHEHGITILIRTVLKMEIRAFRIIPFRLILGLVLAVISAKAKVIVASPR